MLPLLIPAAAQFGLGLVQSLTSGAGAAQSNFEKFAKQRPLAQRSKSLDEYYQEARNRYQENPLTTPYYLESLKQADRTTAQQLANLQSRGAALGSIGKIGQLNLDAKSRGLQGSLAQKAQQFSQYGQAAQLQNQQDKYLYDVNQATPFNTMLGIQQMKSQAANDRKNAGLSMMGSALGNYAMGSMYRNNNPTSKIPPADTGLNLASYKTPAATNWATNTYDFVKNATPFTSANPSAAYTNYMDFGKNNPLRDKYTAPKTYNSFVF